MSRRRAALAERVQQTRMYRNIRSGKIYRAMRHRDFRILWSGAFLSFIGSWIQSVAQGWLVWQLTQDEAKLALVAFCAAAPVSLFGPFAGSLVDTMNKKTLLVVTQSVFGLGALFIAAAIHFDFVRYEHILMVALITGSMAAIEMPARQSTVSSVVPAEDLPMAIPLNALTFNSARVIGPAIGGILLAAVGAQFCYLINGISYLALIVAVVAIRADLRATRREPQPIQDLLFEGMLYTFRDIRLRTLFLLEGGVSMFGLFYIAQMPAIVDRMLGLGEQGLGAALTSIGIGGIVGLLTVTRLSDLPIKALLIRLAMTAIGLSLFLLSFAGSAVFAFPLFVLIGFASVTQFNTTNTLFQLLSPERLRGRVLSMHIWALAGLGPFGTLFFGWVAKETSLPFALRMGGLLVLSGAMGAWIYRKSLEGVE
jgi:MFS family permease